MDERPTLVGSRAVVWTAAAVCLVIIVVAGIVAATRSPAEFTAGTPEFVAQAYLQALLDGDERAAHGYLSEALQERCTVSELRHAWRPESLRITLSDTVRLDDTTEVELIVIEGSTDPFGGAGEYDVTLVLRHVEETWVISEAPWPVEGCEMEGF